MTDDETKALGLRWMACKRLTKRDEGYREHIEGWTCDYARERFDGGDMHAPGYMWQWVVWRGSMLLAQGWCRTRTAARAAVRAVVMERETRGLERRSIGSMQIDQWTKGRVRYRLHIDGSWSWWVRDANSFVATEAKKAPTLAVARKAARKAAREVSGE